MRNKRLIVLVFGIILTLALIAGCAQPALTPVPAPPPVTVTATATAPAAPVTITATAPAPAPATQEPEFTVDLRSAAIGGFGYSVGAVLEEVSRNHPWLRVAHSGGAGSDWAVEFLAKTPQVWQNTIILCNDVSIWQAINGTGAFTEKIPEAANIQTVATHLIDAIAFVTFDPNIKTINDLNGKRVGVGTKGQSGYYQLPALIIDKVFGIQPEYSFLGPTGAVSALLDGKVDAAVTLLSLSSDATKVVPPAALMEASSSSKPLYYIDWTEKLQEAKGLFQNNIHVTKVAANALKDQPQPFWVFGKYNGFYAHRTFSERAAYEFVKVWIANADQFTKRSAEFELITPKMLVVKEKPEDFHKGALKAYQDAGVLK